MAVSDNPDLGQAERIVGGMSLRPISYERIPADDPEPGRCYMCWPPHAAEWRAGEFLRLCTKVLDRLVAQGKAVKR